MATIVYLDETGDHSLEKDDKDFSVVRFDNGCLQ